RCGIRRQAKLRGQAGRSLATRLHLLVNDHEVPALAVRKERAAEAEAVDLTLHAELPALAPYSSRVKRHARDHPAQIVLRTLQHGFKSTGSCFGSFLGSGHQRLV